MKNIKIILVSLLLLCSTQKCLSKDLRDDSKNIQRIIKDQIAINALNEKVPIRKIYGPFISNNYASAIVSYDPEGATSVLFIKRDGSWSVLEAAGGAFSKEHMAREFQIPQEDVDEIFRQENEAMSKEKPRGMTEREKDIFQIQMKVIAHENNKETKFIDLYGPFVSSKYAVVTIEYKSLKRCHSLLKKENDNWIIIKEEVQSFNEELLVKANVPLKDAEEIVKQQKAYWKNRKK